MTTVWHVLAALREYPRSATVVAEYGGGDESGLGVYVDDVWVGFIDTSAPDEPVPDYEPEPPLASERELWAERWIAEHVGRCYRRPRGHVIYRVIGGDVENRFAVLVLRSSDYIQAVMSAAQIDDMVEVPAESIEPAVAARLDLLAPLLQDAARATTTWQRARRDAG